MSKAVNISKESAAVFATFAANDSAFYQARGITAYGFYPFVVPPELLETEHGNDERLPAAQVRRGAHLLYQLILAFDKL